MLNTYNFKHKIHIQSLRAISVILVYLYHVKFPFFYNGYLGVDIFFVISGYVITQSLIKSYNTNNKIDFFKFYSKRFKRIFPNLLFIITITFVFFLFFGPPNLTFWNDYIFSLLGISNIYFLFAEKGYFYDIFNNPFAHTWSLGVEEQFYFLYPLVLFCTFFISRNFLKSLTVIVGLLIALSLFFSIKYSFTNPDLVFYFSPLRFWQLGFGCLCFLITDKINYKSNALSVLAIIFIFLTTISNLNEFSQYKNIMITFISGYFIIIYKKIIILENKILQFYGNISYSFYLWHLPIIYFVNLYVNNYLMILLISFSLSTIFSFISYNYIERFFIKKTFSIKFFQKYLPYIFLVIIPIFYIKYFNENLRYDLRNKIYNLNYLQANYNWNERVIFQQLYVGNTEVHQFCNSIQEEDDLNKSCLKEKNKNYLFFLEGDSHTAQHLNMFNNNPNIENLYFTSAINNKISKNLLKKISIEYDHIIYVTDINNKEKMFKILESEIVKIPNLSLLLFNSTPFIYENINPQLCISKKISCDLRKNKDKNIRKLNDLNEYLEKLKANNSKIRLFDSYNKICPGDICKIYDKEDDILYFMDKTHITSEASILLEDQFNQYINKNFTFLYK